MKQHPAGAQALAYSFAEGPIRRKSENRNRKAEILNPKAERRTSRWARRKQNQTAKSGISSDFDLRPALRDFGLRVLAVGHQRGLGCAHVQKIAVQDFFGQ